MSEDANYRKIESLYEKVKRSFAGISDISVAQLRDLQAGDGKVVLVDVRTPEEQAVSMIPGAVTLQDFEANASDYEGATVVPYCTIGGRSGRMTEQLAARGWNACNLRGAILAWTHAGGDLVCADGPTRRVHVHDRKFALVADGYESVY
jgi:sodium/bile acid cotransporter 7